MVTPPSLPDVDELLPPTPDKVASAAKDVAGVLIKNAPHTMILNALEAVNKDASSFANQLAASMEKLTP